jgi:hypothetical protein
MEGDNDESEQLQERKDDSEVGNVICKKKEEGKNDVGGHDPLTNTEEGEKDVEQGEGQQPAAKRYREEEKQEEDSSQLMALASQPEGMSHYPGEEKNDIILVEAKGQQAAMRLNKLPGPPCTTKRGVTQGRIHGSGEGGYADLTKRPYTHQPGVPLRKLPGSGTGGFANLSKPPSEQGEGQQASEDEQEAANTMVSLLMECKNGSDKGARDSEEDDLPISQLKDHRRGKKRKERFASIEMTTMKES